MAVSKPTHGYKNRTEAVLALRAKGKRISDVAEILGISTNAASGLESSANRYRAKAAKNVSIAGSTVNDLIPLTARQRLRPHAAKRGVSLDSLISAIIVAVAEDDIVDAVLDDGESA